MNMLITMIVIDGGNMVADDYCSLGSVMVYGNKQYLRPIDCVQREGIPRPFLLCHTVVYFATTAVNFILERVFKSRGVSDLRPSRGMQSTYKSRCWEIEIQIPILNRDFPDLPEIDIVYLSLIHI